MPPKGCWTCAANGATLGKREWHFRTSSIHCIVPWLHERQPEPEKGASVVDWLFESPWTIIIVGVVIELVLGLIFMNTGRAAVLFAMLGVAVVVALGVLTERLVVTEREQIEGALYGAAAALEDNDLDALFEYVGPEAQSLRDRAAQVMPRYKILEAKVGGLKLTVNHVTNPPTARTELVGRFKILDESQRIPYENYIQRFVIRWRRDGDRWLMVDYEEGPGGSADNE